VTGGVSQAEADGAAAVVVQLDTLGGSESSMTTIYKALENATIPTIVWVGPSGAKAASAGTFITLSAGLAYMADGTNIGAASPVAAGGGDLAATYGQTEADKVMNDAIATMRAIVQERHPLAVAWAISTVQVAQSYTAQEALDAHWAGCMQKVLDDLGPLAGQGKAFNNVLIDSYEVGDQSWTPRARAEFQKRRGYDPLLYLPTIAGWVVENPAVSQRFEWDERRTAADMFAENYFGHFQELCHQHGLMASIEPYTGPFESLQCGAPSDVVMGEFWSGSQGHPSIKLAASIAHIYGKTIVGAESFTAARGPQTGRWLEDPYSLKALGDLMYCQGLNRYSAARNWNILSACPGSPSCPKSG